jgi:hypothetical protein
MCTRAISGGLVAPPARVMWKQAADHAVNCNLERAAEMSGCISRKALPLHLMLRHPLVTSPLRAPYPRQGGMGNHHVYGMFGGVGP